MFACIQALLAHKLALPPLQSALRISNRKRSGAASRRGRRIKTQTSSNTNTMPKSTSGKMGPAWKSASATQWQWLSTNNPPTTLRGGPCQRQRHPFSDSVAAPAVNLRRNVTSYHVDVTASASFLNFFVNAFGSFPRTCAIQEVPKLGRRRPPRLRRLRKGLREERAVGDLIVPRALRKLTLLDVEVTVRAYGRSRPSANRKRR